MSSYVPEINDRVLVKPSWSDVYVLGEILAVPDATTVPPKGEPLYKVGYDADVAEDGWDYFDLRGIQRAPWFTVTIEFADDPESNSEEQIEGIPEWAVSYADILAMPDFQRLSLTIGLKRTTIVRMET